MATESIKLKAEARSLGIGGYRQMSDTELRAAISKSKGKGSTGSVKGVAAKGKASTNGTKGTAAAKGAVKGAVAKGKASTTATKGSPTKGTARKSAPAKSTKTTARKGAVAKGAQAKRPTTAKTSWQPGSRGRVPASATKAQIKEHEQIRKQRLASPVKGKATVTKTTARGKTAKAGTGAARIDNKAIDWRAESNVGQSGKRKEVLDALRKFKGDTAKVVELLKPNAKKYYPAKNKHDAERMLVWLVNRVKYDFVMNSGQHTPGSRAEYGTSDKPLDVARREQRAKEARAAKRSTAGQGVRKAPAARKAPAKGKATRTATRKPATAQKGTQRRTAAKGTARKGR